VQKPLTWSGRRARALARKSKSNPKLATQMGTRATPGTTRGKAVEYVWAGAIGDVREIISGRTARSALAQGIPRPEARTPPENGFRWNGPGIEARLATAMAATIRSGHAELDLFLGVAPSVEYHPVYHPFNWRGWTDWGVGAIGDMGAHLIDHAMWRSIRLPDEHRNRVHAVTASAIRTRR